MKNYQYHQVLVLNNQKKKYKIKLFFFVIIYLLSVPLVNLFNLVKEFFLCIVVNESAGFNRFAVASQRFHQSREIRYHDVPGFDVERLQLIQ